MVVASEGKSDTGAWCAGTYAGITENLAYLKSLGVNAIELLPVHEFNEMEYYGVSARKPALVKPGLGSTPHVL